MANNTAEIALLRYDCMHLQNNLLACSVCVIAVKHTITVSASEPSITWFNRTVNVTTTQFDFDGICNVTITCMPDLMDVSHSISASVITMTVQQNANTQLMAYRCSVLPYRGERTFPTVYRDAFFGDEILDLQVRVAFVN